MRPYTVLSISILALLVLALSGVIGAPAILADDGGSKSGPGGAVAKKKPKIDPSLFAIGSISASDVWTSYMLVAVTSDHFVEKGYTREQVEKILTTRVRFNAKAIDALQKVAAETTLTADDTKHLQALVGAYRAIGAYGKSVLAFAADKSQVNAHASEAKRKTAWAKVKSSLGIK